MTQTVLGATTFSEQPKRRNKVRGRGWVRVRTWMGPRASVDEFITGTVNSLDPESIEVSEGTPAIITATFPDEETGIDALQQAEDEAIWELLPYDLDKALAQHPSFAVSGTSPKAIETIEKAIRDGTASDRDFDAEFGLNNINNFRDIRIRGVDSFRTWGYIIRKTISVGRKVLVQVAQKETQKVVQYSEIGLPSDIKWLQPVYREWNGVGPAVEKPIAEWLAAPPSIRYTKKKYEIVKEWLGAVQWYATLYEGGTAGANQPGNNK